MFYFAKKTFGFTRHAEGKIFSGVVQEGQALWLPAGCFLFTDMMQAHTSGGGAIGCAGLKLMGVQRHSLDSLERLQAYIAKDHAQDGKADPQ